MQIEDTTALMLLIATLYRFELTEPFIEANHMVLKDLDAKIAMEATQRLCRRDSGFAPQAGEIAAECERLTGVAPPSLDVALGYYLSGEWTVHPMVERAAKSVFWDRHVEPYKAQQAFRHGYQAVIHESESGVVREPRPAITAGPSQVDPGRVLPPRWQAENVRQIREAIRKPEVEQSDESEKPADGASGG